MFGRFFWGGNDFDELFKGMDRLFQELFGPTMRQDFFRQMFAPAQIFEPKIEMYETPDEIVIKAEMPGVDKDSIDVRVRGRHLIIKGVKKQERKSEEENVFFSESFYGEFQRIVPLPVEVKPEGIEAVYDKGILEIRLPKADSARKEVKIIVKEPEDNKGDKEKDK